MKHFLFTILLFMSSVVTAEKLDLIFRYYDKEGHIVTTPLNLYLGYGEVSNISTVDAGGWQHWQIDYSGFDLQLQVINRSPGTVYTIEIHPDWKKTLKTLVINRIQESDVPWVLKVNHLTCRWTSGIAYPVEYRFNNVLDGQVLKLKHRTCTQNPDSSELSIHVLSDSVMLFRCGKNEAILFKYFLGNEGQFFRSFAPSECLEFNSVAEKELYILLKNSSKDIRFSWEGSNWLISDPDGCKWSFEF